MIVTRSPLRISLGGAGTDLPPDYQDHGGFPIAAALNDEGLDEVRSRFDFKGTKVILQ